jgi:hypothetical protein
LATFFLYGEIFFKVYLLFGDFLVKILFTSGEFFENLIYYLAFFWENFGEFSSKSFGHSERPTPSKIDLLREYLLGDLLGDFYENCHIMRNVLMRNVFYEKRCIMTNVFMRNIVMRNVFMTTVVMRNAVAPIISFTK